MKQQNYELLNDLLEEFIQERNKIQNCIQDNLFRIEEIDLYLQSLYIQEDKNNKIFSPRNIEFQHKNEIQMNNQKKESYLDDNKKYYNEVERLDNYISIFHFILYSEKNEGRTEKPDKVQRDKNLTVLSIQEEERQRIARDLHDTSLQNLAHLIHKIELSSLYIDQDPLRAKLELAVVSKYLKTIIEEIRDIIFNLRPMSFDDFGMKDTIERLLTKLNENNQFEIEQEIEDVSCENQLVLVSIYRIIHECISNAVKHSKGNKLFFSLKAKDDVCKVIIQDNGKGFVEEEIQEKRENHFGLSVMRERMELLGGKMEMESGVDGTTIILSIPLK